jgi:hypothetical protein
VPVVPEQPEEPSSEPVVVIAVHDDRRVVRDARAREQLLELAAVEEVAHGMLLQVRAPVQADGAFHVPLLVGPRVDIDLEHANVRVRCVRREPLGVDERFGMCVLGHVVPPS